MTDYSTTVIYTITNDKDDVTYVGSTVNWNKRKGIHKHYCHKEGTKKYNISLYQHMREFGYDTFKFTIIEHYIECKSDEEKRIREREYYDKLNPLYNSFRPYITKEEALQSGRENHHNNKEHNNKVSKKYYEEHKEVRNAKQKVWYQNNKESNLEYQKNWREENKYKLAVGKKKWAEDNKERLNAKRIASKIVCECGGTYTGGRIKRHIESKKHQKYITIKK